MGGYKTLIGKSVRIGRGPAAVTGDETPGATALEGREGGEVGKAGSQKTCPRVAVSFRPAEADRDR